MPVRIISRRPAAALALIGSTLLSAAAIASPALARDGAKGASHNRASVTVRVLGPAPGYSPLRVRHISLAAKAVARYGGSCTGLSAAGALQVATGGDWSGAWSANFADYEVTGIEGIHLAFEPNAAADWYWGFWFDGKQASTGVCEVMPKPGDTVLFLPECYGKACPKPPTIGSGAIAASVSDIRGGHRYSAAEAPRKLVGTASSSFDLEEISIALTRTSGHRCWALRSSGRLAGARCGRLSFFKSAAHHAYGHSTGFSMALQHRLPAGRYVLRVRASDVAGDRSAGSKVTFDVR